MRNGREPAKAHPRANKTKQAKKKAMARNKSGFNGKKATYGLEIRCKKFVVVLLLLSRFVGGLLLLYNL
jgi:hypothetical protein